MADLRDDKAMSGLGEVLSLSIPASLSMLSRTLMQFVDGLMVSRLGPAALSAQSIGALTAFVPESFAMGVLGVVSTYVSQNLGAGRLRRTGQYAWAGIILATVMAILILPLAFLARPLFGLIGHAADVQPLETLYFRYMIVAAFLTLPSRVLEQFFYGIHKPRVVFAASITANAFNVLANYALIFGKFGFPRLGLQGAAIGTLVSWSLQLVILLSVFGSYKIHQRFGSRFVAAVRLRQCWHILRIGWPAGVQFSSAIFSWSVFLALLVGCFGTVHLAAATAAARYMHLSFMPAIGINIAACALVGKYIGQGRTDLARRRAHAGLATAMAYMGACALVFLVFRHQMVAFFVNVAPQGNLSAAEAQARAGEIISVGGNILLLAAVFQIFDAVGIVFSGALRGAGDTLWPMVVMITINWLVLIGGGTLMVVFLPQLQSVGPYLAATTYVILCGLIMAWRFESGAWKKIDLLGVTPRLVEPIPPEVAPVVAPSSVPIPSPASSDSDDQEQ